MQEEQLPAALAADLEGSFASVVESYQDRLYAFALRLTHHAPDATEILVDTFSRAYEALSRYEPARIHALILRPWLYQIALNVCRNRARRRPRWVPLEHGGLDAPDAVEARPEARLMRAEMRAVLAAHLGALPQREREAVVLRHVQGFTYAEMATLLQQPVGTIKANVHRGLKRLRAALQTCGEWR